MDQESLMRVASRAFEETAFVFTEPNEAAVQWSDEVAEVSLEFHGPTGKGHLYLASTKAFGAELAMNMLGCEPGDGTAEASAGDALREMVNILAGVVTEEIFGPGVLCELGLPTLRLREAANDAAPPGADASASLVAGEGHRVDLWVRMGEAA